MAQDTKVPSLSNFSKVFLRFIYRIKAQGLLGATRRATLSSLSVKED